MKRWMLMALALVAGVLTAETPVKIDATIGEQIQAAENLSARELITSDVRSDWLDLGAGLSFNSDGRYGADIAYMRNSGTFFGNYFLLEKGYTALHLKPVELSLGRQVNKEVFVSPYSLFLNSKGLAAPSAIVSFDSEHFYYESRWIELNSQSNFGSSDHTPMAWRYAEGKTDGSGTGFPDRGANLKTFLFKWGTMRFGLQEAGVYTKKTFDPEYFLNPVPEYFIQYYKGTAGRPWTTNGNENYLMGLFWDWREPGFSLGFQFLDDDFNLNFLSNEMFPNNPWKAAWTLGGTLESDWGRWGLYHAGALKYTFEPISASAGAESESAYGYSYYPDVEYWTPGGFRAMAIEDNAIGYLHGENNAALMLTWSRPWNSAFSTSAELEFLLAGANSPANPWQEGTGNQSDLGTHWLDDPVLQKSIVWNARAAYRWGDWDFTAALKVGYLWNALKLVAPNYVAGLSSLDAYAKIYRPSSENQTVAALILGATWHWDLAALLGTLPPVSESPASGPVSTL